MISLNHGQIEAAQAFANTTIALLQTERGVHAETAIAGAARMAGAFLFRSFGFALEGVQPGQPVLSDEANEQGPQLVQILAVVLTQAGIRLDAEQLGKPAGAENRPLLDFLETQRRLEPAYSGIRTRLGLSFQEAAASAAVAAALLIQQCAQVLDPNTAFSVALYGFMEGAKTAPAPITPADHDK